MSSRALAGPCSARALRPRGLREADELFSPRGAGKAVPPPGDG